MVIVGGVIVIEMVSWVLGVVLGKLFDWVGKWI